MDRGRISREDEIWMDAACVGEDPALFDTDLTAKYDRPMATRIKMGKKICETCDIKPDCLQYALDNNMSSGVWGGLSSSERNELKRKTSRPRRSAY